MLLVGPISHTSIQYMDFVEIFNVSQDLSTIYFISFILVGVKLAFCIVVTVVTLFVGSMDRELSQQLQMWFSEHFFAPKLAA